MTQPLSRTVLGIDPGLQHTGWGIIHSSGSQLKHIANGTIHTSPKAPLASRLQQLYAGIETLMATYRIDSVAIEETFVNRNPLSSLKLGHARGVLMVAIKNIGNDVTEYAATTVKKTVCGRGKAEKAQVEAMLGYLLPGVTPDSPDSADALAVAICHAHHQFVIS